MGKWVDISGQKFGRLLVLFKTEKKRAGSRWWMCRCDCGKEIPVEGKKLKSGHTKSCGCYHNEVIRKASITHGMSAGRPPEYAAWVNMKQRCVTNRESDAGRYKERGIRVCDRWIDSFENFISDMGSRPGPGYSIERLNNNGIYEPGNCIWATAKTQARNRSTSRMIEYNNETRTLAEWCEILGVRYGKAINRLRRGYPVDKIFFLGDFPNRPEKAAGIK